MRILIIGGNGMAGHMIHDYFIYSTTHEVWKTIRGESNGKRVISLDVTDQLSVIETLNRIRPDIVINTVGLLNDDAARRQMEAVYVNSLFPHQLTHYGQHFGYRLIHISTDCVFSGNSGNYKETDITDGTTVYAKTKSLGEIIDDVHLTIRTSIIGPELKEKGIGLFHWFMHQKGEIQGYRQVLWNGVTTLELAKTIEWTLRNNTNGLVHLTAPEKLSKFALLNQLGGVFERDDVFTKAYDGVSSDRSLVNTRPDFSYPVLNYSVMLKELKEWIDIRGKKVYHYH